MGRSTEQHQGTAHADDVLLALEDVCDVNLNTDVLVLLSLHNLGKYAAAATGTLVLWTRKKLLLVVRIRQFGRSACSILAFA